MAARIHLRKGGSTGSQIVDSGAGVITAGGHEPGGMRRSLMGGDFDSVVHYYARCPVFLVRCERGGVLEVGAEVPCDEAEKGDRLWRQKILCVS